MKRWIISVAVAIGVLSILCAWAWAGLHVSKAILLAPLFGFLIVTIAFLVHEFLYNDD